MLAAEVLTRLPFVRDCTNAIYQPFGSVLQPSPGDAPATIAVYTNCTGGAIRPEHSHTEWHHGDVHHSGFTTAWTPNFRTPIVFAGRTYPDGDVLSNREMFGAPTFAAVTARSYHNGGVNVLMGDSSVQFITDAVDGLIWRALGTPAGNDSAPDMDSAAGL
jgi:prepilin-type processing-associated H-X9-DG protein